MLENILGVLFDHHRVVITTHRRPDGDAIGSQLALGRFLERLGKEVLLLNSDPVPSSLGWMPGSDTIQSDTTLQSLEVVSKADLFIVVDANSRDRLGQTIERVLDLYTGPVLLIDHHTAPESWFTWMLRDENAAATGELIYDLICTHDRNMIDAPIATALYTALMTDTGSFRFASVTPKIHRIIADLLERGSWSPIQIYGRVHENRARSWPRFISKVLQSVNYLYDGKLAYVILSRHLLSLCNADSDDTQGISDMLMSIEGVEITLIFTETSRGVKVSFRSKGDYPMDTWAQILGGGGHQNAAGAFITSPIREVVEMVLDASPKIIQEEVATFPNDDPALFRALSSSNQ